MNVTPEQRILQNPSLGEYWSLSEVKSLSLKITLDYVGVVPLYVWYVERGAKETREKIWAREILLGARSGHIFFVGFFRVSLDELSKKRDDL